MVGALCFYFLSIIAMVLFVINPYHFRDIVIMTFKVVYAMLAICVFIFGFFYPPLFILGGVMLYDQHYI